MKDTRPYTYVYMYFDNKYKLPLVQIAFINRTTEVSDVLFNKGKCMLKMR